MVSFIDRGNQSTQRKPPTCCKSLTHISSIWAWTKHHLWWIHVVDLPEMTSPEVTLTGSDRVCMRNRNLGNTCPSGAFWPEVTSSNVTRSHRKSRDPEGGSLGCVHVQLPSCAISALVGPFDRKWRHHPVSEAGVPLSVCMRNQKLCNIGSSGAFSLEVTSSAVGLPLEVGGCSLGRPRLSFSSPGYLIYNFRIFKKCLLWVLNTVCSFIIIMYCKGKICTKWILP